MATKGDISGLDVLVFGGKPIVPQVAQGGFERVKTSGVVRSAAAGGASRQRKKYFGNTHIAEVTFYLETAQQQDYMEMFINRNEGKRFICHLAADRPIVEPYVVQLDSDVTFSDVNAKDATASMTLEIFSARDPVLDDWLYELYQSIGDTVGAYVNGFKDIVKAMPYDK